MEAVRTFCLINRKVNLVGKNFCYRAHPVFKIRLILLVIFGGDVKVIKGGEIILHPL